MIRYESDLQISTEVRRPAPGPAMTRRGERLVIILLAVNEEVLLARQLLRLAQAQDVSILLLGIASVAAALACTLAPRMGRRDEEGGASLF